MYVCIYGSNLGQIYVTLTHLTCVIEENIILCPNNKDISNITGKKV